MKLFSALGLALLCAATAPTAAQVVGPTPIEELHLALHLSPGQELGWQTYRSEADARPHVQERRRAAEQMFPTLGAPQRMDLVEAEMKEELLEFERQSHALKALYASLDTAQQRVFDARTLSLSAASRSRP